MTTPSMVACLGDSLTLSGTGIEFHSWPARLDVNPTLFPQCGVSNYGKGGDQSSGFLTRYTDGIAGEGFSALVILGCINDVTNDVPAATTWINIEAIVDDALAEGLEVILCSTTPFGSHADYTAPRQAELLALRALFAAKAGVTFVDLYTLGADPDDATALNPDWDYGDGKHYNAAGGIAIEGILAPILAALFPAEAPPVVVTVAGVSTFGVTYTNLYSRHLPQMSAPTSSSNPAADTVTEIIEECAATLEAKLLQEGITASAITVATDAPYLWCRQTLRLQAMVEVLPVLSGQDSGLLKRLQAELDARWADLASKGYLALGTGTGVSAPEQQPDGPRHHIDSLGLDTSDNEAFASTITARLRRDDEL